MATLSLVVLAAGIGSRYGGLKQVDPIGPDGEIVVDYSVFDAVRSGFDEVVFVIRREIEKDFRASIGRRVEGRVSVRYVFQQLEALPPGHAVPAGRAKPWGTGHAILACREAVETPFGVVNADDLYGRRSYAELAGFLRTSSAAEDRYGLVAFVLRNTLSEHGSVARGICEVTADGLLARVTERTKIEKDGEGATMRLESGDILQFTGDEPASMNMWGFTPALFPHLERQFGEFLARTGPDQKSEFFIPSVVDQLIRAGKATVRVLHTPERWYGVTYPQDKPTVVTAVRDLAARGIYPSPLWG